MTEENETPKTEFDKFASAAMRGPRKSTYMQLLSGLLVKANQNSEPLKKIQTICEAAYVSKQKDKLDMQTIEVSYTLAVILAKVEPPRKPDAVIHIPWSFPCTEENWKKYVEPWHIISLTFYAYCTELRKSTYPEKPVFSNFPDYEGLWEQKKEVALAIRKEIAEMPDYERFFQMTSALALESFYALKSEFENWALTKLLAIQTVIADQVDPKVFTEVLGLMFGQKEEKPAEEVEG